MNQPPRQFTPPVQFQPPQQPNYPPQPAQAVPVYNAQPAISVVQPTASAGAIAAKSASKELESSLLSLANNLAMGLVGGFLAASLMGPMMMCGSLAAIGTGLAIGGLSANLSKGNLSAYLFAILVIAGGIITAYGFNEMRENTDRMNESLNQLRNIGL